MLKLNLISAGRRISRAALVLLLVLLALTPAWAVPARWRDVVEALAHHGANGQVDVSDRYFNLVGFDHDLRMSIPEWSKQSVIEKLDHLYAYADAGKRGGGREALVEFARYVHDDFGPGTGDVIKNLVNRSARATSPLIFTKPKLQGPMPSLPVDLQAAAVAIAEYVGDGSYMSAGSLLRKAKLRPEQIYKIFQKSHTIQDAIVMAIADRDPRAQKSMLGLMAQDVFDQYPMSRTDRRLQAFAPHPGHSPDPPVAPPAIQKRPIKPQPGAPATDKSAPPKPPDAPLRGGACRTETLESALSRILAR